MASPITRPPSPVRRHDDAACSSVELLDRLLNDPDVALEPHKVWDLLEALAGDGGLTPPEQTP
jgi:hypothetical protein